MKAIDLIEKVKQLFACDMARIAKFPDRAFLIVGYNRRSEGEWVNQDGEPQCFDYLLEQCIAQGLTLEALWRDARRFKQLENKTAIEAILEGLI